MESDKTRGDTAVYPRISAVIPTYNRGHLIGRAVESAWQQSYPPFEIIVVDDGSTDDTRERVAQIQTRLGERVRYIYQENRGSAVARDQGFRAATCEWVALLDSDDVWLKTHLERMVQAIEATDGVAGIYFADTIQPTEKGGGSRWQRLDFAIEAEYQLMVDASAWVMMRPQPMMLQSTLFNRAAYFACGGFLSQLRYRDDTHLFLKLGFMEPVCAVSGFATQMTSDDDPANRLTLSFNAQAKGNQMQVIMFEDLLAGASSHKPALKPELRRRLASAHRSLARVAWAERRPFTAIKEVSRTVLADPTTFWRRLFRPFQR